jgi:ParB family chromosome partitioning protein
MANKKNNTTLGRGLSSLIDSNQLEGYKEVDIEEIVANPYQPRLDPTQKIDKLAKSIIDFGVISPLIVTKLENGKYQLIAGERRLNAAKKAGLKKVPIIIKEKIKNSDILLIAIIENLQREDLNLIEKATAVGELKDKFHMTAQEIADKLNISPSVSRNLINISKLSDTVKAALKKDDISIKHAVIIIRLPTIEDQLYVIKRIIKENLTMEKTREVVINLLADKYRVIYDKFVISSHETLEIQNDLRKRFGSDNIKIMRQFSGNGYIKIPFTTDRELSDIVEKLKKSH